MSNTEPAPKKSPDLEVKDAAGLSTVGGNTILPVILSEWEGFELSAKNKLMLFVPRGFAHSFCTIEENTEFVYKVDGLYAPESDSGIIWNDPTLNINWPTKEPILSEKDKVHLTLNELNSPF